MTNNSHSDLKIILHGLGMVFIVVGVLAVIPLLVSAYYNENLLPFFLVSVIPLLIGIGIEKILKEEITLQVKHATITAALTYLFVAILGSLPFMFYGMNFLDAFFEAMSGWTTTGLTMSVDVESLPKSLLFWRSFMQWVGGIGVIVLMLVILASTGSATAKLYYAEARKDRIKPRLLSTVRLIWWIYLLYTFIGILLYYIAGMSLFDSLNHSMALLSTGGFSTHNLSIQGFNSIRVEEVSIIIMLLGATNFMVHYKVLTGAHTEFYKNLETRALYLLSIAGAVILFLKIPDFRASLFQTVSAITTTGASSIDVAEIDDFSKLSMSFMMMLGATTGSTGGGFKIIRLIIVLRLIYWWVQKKILPEHTVFTKKLGGVELSDADLQEPATYLLLYLLIYSFGVLVFVYMGFPTIDSIFEVVSSLSNVGLSTGITSITLNSIGKIVLIFNMWIGRLEIIPVLVLAQSILFFRRK